MLVQSIIREDNEKGTKSHPPATHILEIVKAPMCPAMITKTHPAKGIPWIPIFSYTPHVTGGNLISEKSL